MIKRYGVSNYGQTDEAKKNLSKRFKGQKNPRTKEHQQKIIDSKRKNGNLKHTQETKNKISKILLNSENMKKAKEEGKFNTKKNSGGIEGYYKGIYFRSSLELSFLVKYGPMENAENSKYRIEYGNNNYYYPDFADNNGNVYEIKPSNLLTYGSNPIKIEEAKKVYKEKYIVITEKECPYISKKEIELLIQKGVLTLTDRGKDKLTRYQN
jgi:hypothetical protein